MIQRFLTSVTRMPAPEASEVEAAVERVLDRRLAPLEARVVELEGSVWVPREAPPQPDGEGYEHLQRLLRLARTRHNYRQLAGLVALEGVEVNHNTLGRVARSPNWVRREASRYLDDETIEKLTGALQAVVDFEDLPEETVSSEVLAEKAHMQRTVLDLLKQWGSATPMELMRALGHSNRESVKSALRELVKKGAVFTPGRGIPVYRLSPTWQ